MFSSKKEDPISFEILHVTVKKTFSKNENQGYKDGKNISKL